MSLKNSLVRLFYSFFFHRSTLYGTQLSRLKGFKLFSFSRSDSTLSRILSVGYSWDSKFPLKPTVTILTPPLSTEAIYTVVPPPVYPKAAILLNYKPFVIFAKIQRKNDSCCNGDLNPHCSLQHIF
jgi:hypothetical protein